ncbi:unnamed protein product [Chrysodeixis includens]|uniref:Nucleoporin Nup54 alpha-helical domain-containing protein n=1 Tax=Chrysodeixis includens TaxID=689277 RepID=A0A9N8KQ12_CHRIL|nr:unnamed protein product [Chrysodeixis includens]
MAFSFGAPSTQSSTFGAAAKPTFSFGGATTTTTSSGFGTFGAPATSTGFGTFGAPATSAAPFGQLVSAPASTAPSLFGGTGFGATPAKPATGFGATTFGSNTFGTGTGFGTGAPTFGSAAPAFGSTAPTFGSTAPTFGTNTLGGFGTGGTNFNSSFGAKPATGFGGFGSTLGSSTQFGQPQQQQQQQQQVQQAGPSSAHEALVAAVFNCNVFGDERDQVLAKWNLIQAMWGIGQAYYSRNAPPLELNEQNPLCRFKSVGYSRLSGRDDKDGHVAMMFNKSEQDIKNNQQALITSLQGLLGNKPHLAVNIECVKAVSDNKSQVVIYVVDKNAGGAPVSASELANFLWGGAARGALAGAACVAVTPVTAPTPQMLAHYLQTPPPGMDKRLWKQAQADNPDPENYIPVPIIGFTEIKFRSRCQSEQARLQAQWLQRAAGELAELRTRRAAASARLADLAARLHARRHTLLQVCNTCQSEQARLQAQWLQRAAGELAELRTRRAAASARLADLAARLHARRHTLLQVCNTCQSEQARLQAQWLQRAAGELAELRTRRAAASARLADLAARLHARRHTLLQVCNTCQSEQARLQAQWLQRAAGELAELRTRRAAASARLADLAARLHARRHTLLQVCNTCQSEQARLQAQWLQRAAGELAELRTRRAAASARLADLAARLHARRHTLLQVCNTCQSEQARLQAQWLQRAAGELAELRTPRRQRAPRRPRRQAARAGTRCCRYVTPASLSRRGCRRSGCSARASWPSCARAAPPPARASPTSPPGCTRGTRCCRYVTPASLSRRGCRRSGCSARRASWPSCARARAASARLADLAARRAGTRSCNTCQSEQARLQAQWLQRAAGELAELRTRRAAASARLADLAARLHARRHTLLQVCNTCQSEQARLQAQWLQRAAGELAELRTRRAAASARLADLAARLHARRHTLLQVCNTCQSEQARLQAQWLQRAAGELAELRTRRAAASARLADLAARLHARRHTLLQVCNTCQSEQARLQAQWLQRAAGELAELRTRRAAASARLADLAARLHARRHTLLQVCNTCQSEQARLQAQWLQRAAGELAELRTRRAAASARLADLAARLHARRHTLLQVCNTCQSEQARLQAQWLQRAARNEHTTS